MTRKYKTIAGYLRSCEQRILSKLPTADGPERVVAVVRARQREAINQLLPQIGIDDRIGDDEAPSDAIGRMIEQPQPRADGLAPVRADALAACQRWLKNFFIPLSSTVTKIESGPSF